MKNKVKVIFISILLILSLSLFITNFSNAAFADEITIICNKDIPESLLSKKDIKDIWMGKKIQWADGKKIEFVVLNIADIHDAFLKQYVGKNSSQFSRYWKKQLFTGKGKMPKSFDKQEQLLDYVANTQGTVAYISGSSVNEGVKTLSVK